MAALTFPLFFQQFMALIGLEEGMFSLSRNDQLSGIGNGQPLNAEIASPLWRFEGTTIVIPNDEAEAIAAVFEMLEAPGRDFYVANPRKRGPLLDTSGDILGGGGGPSLWLDFTSDIGFVGSSDGVPVVAALASNNRELAIGGLPPGYVLSRGDMIAWDYGPVGQKRRAFHRLAGTVTASSGGLTPLVELSTFIRPGASVGDPVHLAPATMRAKLTPGSYKPQQAGPLHQRFTFSAIQKLR